MAITGDGLRNRPVWVSTWLRKNGRVSSALGLDTSIIASDKDQSDVTMLLDWIGMSPAAAPVTHITSGALTGNVSFLSGLASSQPSVNPPGIPENTGGLPGVGGWWQIRSYKEFRNTNTHYIEDEIPSVNDDEEVFEIITMFLMIQELAA